MVHAIRETAGIHLFLSDTAVMSWHGRRVGCCCMCVMERERRERRERERERDYESDERSGY
jgi:hypothetical protein